MNKGRIKFTTIQLVELRRLPQATFIKAQIYDKFHTIPKGDFED